MTKRKRDYAPPDSRPADYLGNVWKSLRKQPERRAGILKQLQYTFGGKVHTMVNWYWTDRVFNNPPLGSESWRGIKLQWVDVIYEAFNGLITREDLMSWYLDRERLRNGLEPE